MIGEGIANANVIAFIGWTVLTVIVTCSMTEYTINSEETSKLLDEVCAKNNGINTTKIVIDAWKFKCKDGAVFVIDREGGSK